MLLFNELSQVIVFYWGTVALQLLLQGEVNQLYVYIYHLFFGFPSHLDHHRALSRVPCAIQEVLIGYLFYTY